MSDTTEIQTPETLVIEPQPPPPETQLDTTEHELTGRDAVLAQIVARREQEIADESGVPAEAAPADPPPAPVEEPPAEVAPTPAPEPPPVVRTVQVNGQSYTVTDDQFTQLAQMGALAGMALSQPAPPAPVAPPQPQPQRPIVDDAMLAEVVQKMQFGSPDEGKAALGSLIHHVVGAVPQQQPIDAAKIAALAGQQALNTIKEQRDAEVVRTEFPEIFKDQRRAQEAHAWVNALRVRDVQLGHTRPDIDIYREAGNLVYSQYNLPRPGSDQTTPPALQAAPAVQRSASVEERKRAAPRTLQPVDRRAVPPEQPRETTNAEAIAQMRRDRGLPAFS